MLGHTDVSFAVVKVYSFQYPWGRSRGEAASSPGGRAACHAG